MLKKSHTTETIIYLGIIFINLLYWYYFKGVAGIYGNAILLILILITFVLLATKIYYSRHKNLHIPNPDPVPVTGEIIVSSSGSGHLLTPQTPQTLMLKQIHLIRQSANVLNMMERGLFAADQYLSHAWEDDLSAQNLHLITYYLDKLNTIISENICDMKEVNNSLTNIHSSYLALLSEFNNIESRMEYQKRIVDREGINKLLLEIVAIDDNDYQSIRNALELMDLYEPDIEKRVESLGDIARIIVTFGEQRKSQLIFKKAVNDVYNIVDSERRSNMCIQLAKSMALAGDIESAHITLNWARNEAKRISKEDVRMEMLINVAKTMKDTGDYYNLQELFPQITSREGNIRSLMESSQDYLNGIDYHPDPSDDIFTFGTSKKDQA